MRAEELRWATRNQRHPKLKGRQTFDARPVILKQSLSSMQFNSRSSDATLLPKIVRILSTVDAPRAVRTPDVASPTWQSRMQACTYKTRPSHHNRRKEAHKKNPQPIDRGCHCGAGRQSHLFEREGDPRIMDRIPKGTNAQKDDNTRVSTRTFETRSAPLSNEKMGPFTVSPHRSHDGTHRLDCSTHAAEWPRCRRGLRH
jgi:hypothetical protein